MEEIWELRRALEAGDLQAALAIVDEMEAVLTSAYAEIQEAQAV
jgi:hypothetical protein